MKVVLRSDVNDVGKKGDVVDVADGFARNFLVPKGLAFKASPGAQAQADSMRRSRDVRDAADRTAAEDVARQLVPKVITLSARAGGEGRLFGSITATDVVDAVQAQTGIELDRRKVQLTDPIREVGTHPVTGNTTSEWSFTFTRWVPTSRIGSVSWTLRRSSSMPVWACTASTTSAAVIEPNRRPSPPARADSVITLGTSWRATSSAADRSAASRMSRDRRMASAWA